MHTPAQEVLQPLSQAVCKTGSHSVPLNLHTGIKKRLKIATGSETRGRQQTSVFIFTQPSCNSISGQFYSLFNSIQTSATTSAAVKITQLPSFVLIRSDAAKQLLPHSLVRGSRAVLMKNKGFVFGQLRVHKRSLKHGTTTPPPTIIIIIIQVN